MQFRNRIRNLHKSKHKKRNFPFPFPCLSFLGLLYVRETGGWDLLPLCHVESVARWVFLPAQPAGELRGQRRGRKKFKLSPWKLSLSTERCPASSQVPPSSPPLAFSQMELLQLARSYRPIAGKPWQQMQRGGKSQGQPCSWAQEAHDTDDFPPEQSLLLGRPERWFLFPVC